MPQYVLLVEVYHLTMKLVVDTGLVRNLTTWLEFSSGLSSVTLKNLMNNLRFPFDVDVIVSYM